MSILNKLVKFGIPALSIFLISSCKSFQRTVIPQAVNTVSTVTFRDLNLQKGEYDLLNKVSSDATITVEYKSKNYIVVRCQDDDFSISFKQLNGAWILDKFTGVARLGYLTNDDRNMSTSLFSPEDIVRRFAIYRLINNVQQKGADGLIEPTISTNVVQTGKKTLTFTTHAEGKLIRLKSTK